MAEFDLAKTFLKEHHLETVKWHSVLNNTASTKPKNCSGPVVASISKLKRFEPCGASFANPMVRCILRLPNSFVAGDGKELKSVVSVAHVRKRQRMPVVVPW